MHSSIHSLLRGTFIYGLVGGVKSSLEFLLLPLYCNLLSPSQFGTLDLLMIIIAIASVISILELPNGLFAYYYEYQSKEDKDRLIISAMIWCLCSSMAICLLIFIFSNNIAGFLKGGENIGVLLKLAAIFVVIDSIKTIPLNFLRIKDQPGKYAHVSMIQIGLYLLGVVFLVAVLHMSIKGILIAKLISEGVSLVMALRKSEIHLRLQFDWKMMKSALAFSIPIIPAGISIWGVNSLNRMFLLKYADMDQLGLFALGSKLVVVITLVTIAFQLAWPHFAFSNMKNPNFRNMLGKIFTLFVSVGLWLVLILTLFADKILHLMAKEDFFGASTIVLPLALGMFNYGLFYFFSTGVLIERKSTKMLPAIAVAVAINIVGNLVLTVKFGYIGTAWVSTITYAFMALAMFLLSRAWNLIEFNLKELTKVAIINSLAYIAGRFVMAIGGIASATGLILLAFSVFWMTIKPEEKALVLIKQLLPAKLDSPNRVKAEMKSRQLEKQKA